MNSGYSQLQHPLQTEQALAKEAKEKYEELEEIKNQIPPDWEICDQHREAQYMRDDKELNSDIMKCPCCNQNFSASKFPLCSLPKLYAAYGFGVVLYFKVQKYMTFLFLTFCIAVGIGFFFYLVLGEDETTETTQDASGYTITTTEKHYRIADYDKDGEIGIFFKASIGNAYDYQVNIIMAMTAIGWGLIFFSIWLKFQQKLLAEDTKLNIDTLTVGDYSIQIKNIPTDPNFDEDAFLNACFVRSSLARATFSYDIQKYSKAAENLINAKKKKSLIDNYRKAYKKMEAKKHRTISEEKLAKIYPPSTGLCKTTDFPDYNLLLQDISKYESELKEYEGLKTNQLNRGNVAYITFKNTSESDRILDAHPFSQLDYLIGKSKLKYLGHPIYVKRAPEPEDINWQNLTISTFSRFGRVFVTWFITILILIGCLFANAYIIEYSKNISGNSAKAIGLSFVASMVQVMVNRALAIFISIFTHYEKHQTKTDYQASTAFKLTLAMFINSAIIPLLVNGDEEDVFLDSGLVNNVVMTWLSINFLQPFSEFFSPFYLLHLFKKWRLKRQGEKSKMTQLEANKQFEPMAINMPKKYAECLLVVLYTGFYIQLFPLGLVISILGLAVNYWVDKYLMLRRYKKPERISSNMAHFTMGSASSFVFLLALGNLIFIFLFGNDENQVFMAICPMIVFAIFEIIREVIKRNTKKTPSKKHCKGKCYQYFISSKVNKVEFEDKYGHIPYDLAEFGFRDYMALNPITQEQAQMEFLEAKIKDSKSPEEISQLQSFKNQLVSGQQTGIVTNILYSVQPVYNYQYAPTYGYQTQYAPQNYGYTSYYYSHPQYSQYQNSAQTLLAKYQNSQQPGVQQSSPHNYQNRLSQPNQPLHAQIKVTSAQNNNTSSNISIPSASFNQYGQPQSQQPRSVVNQPAGQPQHSPRSSVVNPGYRQLQPQPIPIANQGQQLHPQQSPQPPPIVNQGYGQLQYQPSPRNPIVPSQAQYAQNYQAGYSQQTGYQNAYFQPQPQLPAQAYPNQQSYMGGNVYQPNQYR